MNIRQARSARLQRKKAVLSQRGVCVLDLEPWMLGLRQIWHADVERKQSESVHERLRRRVTYE
jgi:hypothetical protein